MDEIEKRQREKDRSSGQDPAFTARQRKQAALDIGDIYINRGETEKHENSIKLIRPKFVQLHKLMD